MKRVLVIALLIILPLSVFAQSVEDFLPTSGIIKGIVMVTGAPPELAVLTKRWKTAMSRKRHMGL